jgi:YHS domain-containing protein
MSGEEVDPEGAVKAFDHEPKAGEKAICPVSGKVFIVTDGTATSEHEGKHYAYCCPGCKPRFDANPGAFAENSSDS